MQEQKIVLYLVSKIMPGDEDFKYYEMSVRDFCKVCELDSENGGNYKHIKQTLKNLRDKSVWVKDDSGKERLYAWIDTVTMDENDGKVLIRLSHTMKPYLLQLKEHFTRYSLYYVLAMKSQYSIKVYELLKSYEYKGICEFDLDDLRVRLNAEKYPNHHDFMRRVINTAITEINGNTDIEVSYTLEKAGRRYSKIVLKVKAIKNYSHRVKIHETIDEKLKRKPGRPRKKKAED